MLYSELIIGVMIKLKARVQFDSSSYEQIPQVMKETGVLIRVHIELQSQKHARLKNNK